jgi:hypothetical protein
MMAKASLRQSTKTPTGVFAVIEDDPDIQLLIETISYMDSRFTLANVPETRRTRAGQRLSQLQEPCPVGREQERVDRRLSCSGGLELGVGRTWH